MDRTGPIPLVGQAWLLCGFDVDADEDQDRAELFAAPGETPLLLVPPDIGPEDLEDAFYAAITRLYMARYGVVNLVRGIRAWDAIVADMGSDREQAAD